MFIGKNRMFEEVFTETTNSANTRQIVVIGVDTLDKIVDKVIYVKSNATCTGNVTLQINDLAPKNVKKYTSEGLAELSENSIQENQILVLTYDGTQFVLLNPVV